MRKENKNFKVVLTLRKKFVSVNNLYKARIGYKGGRPYPVVYKNPAAEDVEREVREQLRAVDFSEHREWIKNGEQFKLLIQFILKRKISKLDLGNLLKNLEDILVNFIREDLGIDTYDDSKHVEIVLFKSYIPKAKNEYACIQLSESGFNTKFAEGKLDKEDRVFLGGTCAETNWREDVMKELDKNKVKYFKPVVPDWTPECIAVEDEEKSEKCNVHLYLLTPEMKGVYSVAEVLNSVWEKKSGNYNVQKVLFGILDSDDWQEDAVRSLNATLKLLREIAGNNESISMGWVKEPKDLVNRVFAPDKL